MTSPSTLIRRAAKAKSPAVAKHLRNQAAALRRAQRGKKTRKSTAKKARKPTAADSAAFRTEALVALGRLAETPGWRRADVVESNGEMCATEAQIITGDEIERIRGLARKTHNPSLGLGDSFAIALRANLVGAKHSGKQEAEAAHTDLLRTVHEINAINVVSAFIAEIEGIQAMNRGSLPPTMMVSGYTAARVYSALRDAGYTSEGKSGVRRESISRQGQAVR